MVATQRIDYESPFNRFPNQEEEKSYFGQSTLIEYVQKVKEKIKNLDNPTYSLDDKFDPSQIFVKRKYPQEKNGVMNIKLLEEWEGIINKVYKESFEAHLFSLSNKNEAPIKGTFKFDDVPFDEHHLITIGSVFYWNIGREVKISGQISNGDYFLFRRFPNWKGFDINKSSLTFDEYFSTK